MDELPKHLTALIEDARPAHDPSAEDARRVGQALGVAVPGFVAITSAGDAATCAAEVADAAAHGSHAAKSTLLGSAAAAKWLAVLMTVVAVGTAALMQHASRDHAADAPGAVSRAASAPARAVSVPAVAEPAQPDHSDVVNAPLQAQTPEPASAPVRDLHGQRAAVVRGRMHDRAPTPKAALAPAAPRTRGVTGELALIERAAKALRDHDARLAERILTEHAARFPHGTLVEERRGLSIIALCDQGRIAEAAPLRQRFVEDAARSPLVSRIARVCAER